MSVCLKILGIIVTVIALNAWGIANCLKYRQRIAFWKQMNHMCEVFVNEIQFTADSPQKILGRLSQTQAFQNWQWNETSQSFGDSFCQQAKALMLPLGLEKELQDVQAFGLGLGTTDTQGQCNHCQMYAKNFAQKEQRASEEYATKGKLQPSLCGLFSVAVAVMLI